MFHFVRYFGCFSVAFSASKWTLSPFYCTSNSFWHEQNSFCVCARARARLYYAVVRSFVHVVTFCFAFWYLVMSRMPKNATFEREIIFIKINGTLIFTIDHEPKRNVFQFLQRLFWPPKENFRSHRMQISNSFTSKIICCSLFLLNPNIVTLMFGVRNYKEQKTWLNLTNSTHTEYRSNITQDIHLRIVSKYLSNFRQNIPFRYSGIRCSGIYHINCH